MLLFIILLSALMIHAGVVKEKKKDNCDGVIINNEYYEREVLKDNLDRPFQLAIDHKLNILYFSYSLNQDDDLFKTMYLNLTTQESEEVKVENGFAQAVDNETSTAYVGGSDGVYKYDPKTKKAELIGAKDENIWSVYFNKVLYYTAFPQQFLYAINNGQSVRVKDLEDTKVDQFLLDNEDVFYYTNSTGLYSQKKGTKDAVFYHEFPVMGVRGINMDVNGKVYVCVQDGIYSVEKESATLQKVVDLYDGFGLAFDSGNHIIYSDATGVYRFKPNKEKSCT